MTTGCLFSLHGKEAFTNGVFRYYIKQLFQNGESCTSFVDDNPGTIPLRNTQKGGLQFGNTNTG